MQHILNYNTKEATSLHILNDEKSTIMVFVKCFKMTKCASFYSETQTMKNIVERVYFKSRLIQHTAVPCFLINGGMLTVYSNKFLRSEIYIKICTKWHQVCIVNKMLTVLFLFCLQFWNSENGTILRKWRADPRTQPCNVPSYSKNCLNVLQHTDAVHVISSHPLIACLSIHDLSHLN